MNEILYFMLVKNYTVKKPGKQKRHGIKGPIKPIKLRIQVNKIIKIHEKKS